MKLPVHGLFAYTFVIAAGTSLLCGCSDNSSPARGEADRPNVVLITLDTTRADHLGCYGHPLDTSPNMDALAAEGVRFDLAIAQAGLTPTSHASILTGLNPPSHGVRVVYAASGYRLHDSIPTLATALRDKGWSTGAFLSSFNVSEFFGFDRGFDRFDNGLKTDADAVLFEADDGSWRFDIRANQRRSDETTDRALEWIKQQKGPFCVWIHYWDPHDPGLVPPPEVRAKFGATELANDPAARRRLYDAEIFYVDAQIGRLVRALKDSGRYENTVFVIVCDHGEGLGDHGHWGHRILYQEQIRVALLLRLPDGPGGRVVRELVRTIDIYPTVLELLDVPPPQPVEGRSLLPLIRGEPDEPRVAYADALIKYDLNAAQIQKRRPKDDLLYVAMDQSWKLIYRPTRPAESELYRVDRDPKETINLHAREPKEAARLLEALRGFGGFVNQPFGEGQDREVIERLRSLGYVGDGNEP